MTHKGELERPRISLQTGKVLCIDPVCEPDRVTFKVEEVEPDGLERMAAWCAMRSKKGKAACRYIVQPRCFFVDVDKDMRQALYRQKSRYGVTLTEMPDPAVEFAHLPQQQARHENGGSTAPWELITASVGLPPHLQKEESPLNSDGGITSLA